MKLTSCNNCGVLLDADKINWPAIHLPDGCVDPANAAWNGDDYVAIISCPCCKAAVEEPKRGGVA